VNVAFVLLSTPRFPTGDEIVRAFASFATHGQRLHQRESKARKPPDIQVREFELSPGGRVFVATVPLPVPGGEADGWARFSLSSLDTGWTLPPHKAHVLVTLQDRDSSSELESLSSFTSLLAAVAHASCAVGVYWGRAGATHDAEFFTTEARRPGVMRITLWTGVSVDREPDGRLRLLSTGMTQLGLPDLLLVAPASAWKDAIEAFFSMLAYVAERGEPIRDGDTVGRSPDERLPVRYVPSPVDPSQKVWRVELE
jgi:hypothetical protein